MPPLHSSRRNRKPTFFVQISRTYLKIDFVAKRREKFSGEAAGEKAPEAYCTYVEEFFPENEIRGLCSTLQKNSDFEIGSKQIRLI
jgi:hypothetical protein